MEPSINLELLFILDLMRMSFLSSGKSKRSALLTTMLPKQCLLLQEKRY